MFIGEWGVWKGPGAAAPRVSGGLGRLAIEPQLLPGRCSATHRMEEQGAGKGAWVAAALLSQALLGAEARLWQEPAGPVGPELSPHPRSCCKGLCPGPRRFPGVTGLLTHVYQPLLPTSARLRLGVSARLGRGTGAGNRGAQQRHADPALVPTRHTPSPLPLCAPPPRTDFHSHHASYENRPFLCLQTLFIGFLK